MSYVPICLFLKVDFCLLKSSDRETQRIFCLQQSGWARLEPQAWNSIQDFHVGGRGPGTSASSTACQDALVVENVIGSSVTWTQHRILIQGVGMPNSTLTHCPTRPTTSTHISLVKSHSNPLLFCDGVACFLITACWTFFMDSEYVYFATSFCKYLDISWKVF